MIDPELFKFLCCPETHQELQPAQPALLAQLNRQIEAGALRNRGGQPLKDKLDAGLLRADGKFLYPIRQSIPIMLVEEAIPIAGS
jgi:uncharacterized protein YbaR (Trm112 family)